MQKHRRTNMLLPSQASVRIYQASNIRTPSKNVFTRLLLLATDLMGGFISCILQPGYPSILYNKQNVCYLLNMCDISCILQLDYNYPSLRYNMQVCSLLDMCYDLLYTEIRLSGLLDMCYKSENCVAMKLQLNYYVKLVTQQHSTLDNNIYSI